ncbi:MAG: hypothetical protein IPJ05_02910 [Nitrosomonas sp.]|nr:hypothetical protein [Nitrosomonas sp.]
MAITPIDPAPARNTAGFKPWVESLLETDLPLLSTEMEAAILALNTNSWTGTSTTSYTPNSGGIGTKVFTTQSGKSWLPGQWVTIGYTSDGRENAVGVVQAYSGTSLTLDIKQVSGHSTPRTAWNIAFTPPINAIGDQEVVVHTGNGYGSTNTRIRRYTTTLKASGGDITYADSPTLGASFTFNKSGVYEIYRAENYGSVVGNIGISLNTTTPSASLSIIAERLMMCSVSNVIPYVAFSRAVQITAGDIVRPHDGAALNSNTTDCFMAVKRIA